MSDASQPSPEDHLSPEAELVALIRQDAARWVVPSYFADPDEQSWSTIARLAYHHMPLRAVIWFRISGWCQRRRIPAMTGIIIRRLMRRYGLELTGSIGGGLYIAHPVGCVIAVDRMGPGCSVIAAVTIGMRNTYDFPVIGEGVFIGAGARVLGDLTIGDRAKIGANSVVIRDVAEDATMVGAPARPVGATTPTSG